MFVGKFLSIGEQLPGSWKKNENKFSPLVEKGQTFKFQSWMSVNDLLERNELLREFCVSTDPQFFFSGKCIFFSVENQHLHRIVENKQGSP